MTAKEKAKDLVNKFYNKNIQNFWDTEEAIKEAKQSALINVDENIRIALQCALQSALICVDEIINNDYGSRSDMIFWQEVKQEINKL